MIVTLCDHTLRDYYTKEMVTSNVDQRVFEVLLSQKLPKIYQQIKTKWEIPIPWFTLPWFLCLFIGKLPIKVSLPSFFFFFLSFGFFCSFSFSFLVSSLSNKYM